MLDTVSLKKSVRVPRSVPRSRNSITALIFLLSCGHSSYLFGNEQAVNVDLVYTADIMSVVSGGIADGEAYLDNLDLTVALDGKQLWGLDNVDVFIYGIYNNGAHFSERYVGDAQVASNIETGESAVRLYEAWINFDVGQHSDIRFGLYDLNSEFDVLESSSLFLGSAHGIGSDFSQTGRNGPSIFPNTSLSLRFATELNADWRLQLAVLDAVPGDPEETDRTVIRLSSVEGALLVAEAQRIRPKSRLLLGAWSYTAKTDTLLRQAGSDNRERNSGLYLRGETLVYDALGEVSAFARVGVASDKVNVFSQFLSGGLTWRSFSETRPADEMGIAFAWAEASGDVPAGSDNREIAVEFTYRLQLADRFGIQPNIQYVKNPGLDPSLDDAWVAGARFVFQLF